MKESKLSDGLQAKVTNTELVEERRGQIVKTAIKLFSRQGFYKTTIQDIAREAGFSQGFIYQYFNSKEELLLYSLRVVLDSYENDIPPRLRGIHHPVDRLCATIAAFCSSVDAHRATTVLAYRSSKSLKPEMQKLVIADETRTNRHIREALDVCFNEGYMIEVNRDIMVYQCLMFAHSWALKSWVYRDKFTIDEYIQEGLKILVRPLLTPKGAEFWSKYY